MVKDGLVFKDEDGQVIFNQYSFCELVKHLLVELVGISYAEASQTVERSPLAAPVADALGVAVFSHELPYYWAMTRNTLPQTLKSTQAAPFTAGYSNLWAGFRS